MATAALIAELRADFRGRFREFVAISDLELDRAIEEALHINGVDRLVTLYIAAHILTISAGVVSGDTGATGAVKSDRVGPLQTNYVTLVMNGDIRAELARTAYGARALLLESRTPRTRIGAMVAG